MTLAKLHCVCEVVHGSLGSDKARSYAPPPLVVSVGSGRKTKIDQSHLLVLRAAVPVRYGPTS